MRKNWLRITSIPSLFALTLISCQQEVNWPEQEGCRITKGHYYGGGGMHDSLIFTYEDGRVVRADGVDSYVQYSYTGNQITGRKFYSTMDQSLIQVDTIQYSGNGQLSRMISWFYDDPFYGDTARAEYSFAYSGTRIDRVTEAEAVYSPFGEYRDTAVYLFHTDGAGNVFKLHLADAQLNVFDSVRYQYNTDPNYFAAVHPHFFLFDPYFQLQVGLVVHFPYFYSTNNATTFTIYGNVDYNIVYGLDSLNNVTRVDLAGFDYMKYEYECLEPL